MFWSSLQLNSMPRKRYLVVKMTREYWQLNCHDHLFCASVNLCCLNVKIIIAIYTVVCPCNSLVKNCPNLQGWPYRLPAIIVNTLWHHSNIKMLFSSTSYTDWQSWRLPATPTFILKDARLEGALRLETFHSRWSVASCTAIKTCSVVVTISLLQQWWLNPSTSTWESLKWRTNACQEPG